MGLDITERIIGAVSSRSTPAITQRQGTTHYDVSIAELSFVYAITDQMPYTRETIDFKREQIDTSVEPGEQSLSQWWVRDQESWHRGAGINWYDVGSDLATKWRFHSSMGISPWTKGEIHLHKKTVRQRTATTGDNCFVMSGVVNGADVIFGCVAGILYRYDGSITTLYTSTPVPGTEPAITGAKVLVGSTAGILSGDVTGTSLSTLWSTTTGNTARPFWAKSRIICALANKLYDLTLAGGDLDAATPLYTHPSTTFTWTDVTEAPGAILAAGYDGGYGYIYRFVLDTTTGGAGLPTLSKAIQTSEFPPGETVHSIQAYLGAYIGIGTSKGVRIGTLDSTGVIQYGPLTIATTKPVRCLSARDTFVYAGIESDLDGFSGAARINLADEITDQQASLTATGLRNTTLRFAWAYDVQAHVTGQVQSITFFGVTDRVALGVQSSGLYLQDATALEPTGYLQTGKLRYATSEPKAFQLIKLRASILSDSTLTIDTIDSTDVDRECFVVRADFNTDNDITLKTISDVQQPHAAFKFTFKATADGLSSPVIQSYQIKATPIPHIQRMITMPLQLQDREQDRNGAKYGFVGSAWNRLAALEQMEQDRNVVVVNDWTNGESFTAQIRSVKFLRNTPPARNEKNFGGIVVVALVKL